MLSSNAIITLTRIFVRDARIRRTLMFYLALGAMLMVFVGAVVIDATLREHPFVFLAYWGVCGWITMSAALLAVFDLLAVRAAARAQQRELERQLAEEKEQNT